MMKRKVFTVFTGVALSAAIFAGCSESEISKVEENVEETTDAAKKVVEEEAPKEVEVEETKDLKVGDSVQVNDLKITLNSVRKSMGTNEFDTPTNDAYVILDVKVENTGKEAANVSSLMNFELMDPDGYSQDIAIIMDGKGSLDGEVGPGRTMAGEIGFDVTEAEFYEFIYSEVYSSGQAIFKITQEDLK